MCDEHVSSHSSNRVLVSTAKLATRSNKSKSLFGVRCSGKGAFLSSTALHSVCGLRLVQVRIPASYFYIPKAMLQPAPP